MSTFPRDYREIASVPDRTVILDRTCDACSHALCNRVIRFTYRYLYAIILYTPQHDRMKNSVYEMHIYIYTLLR